MVCGLCRTEARGFGLGTGRELPGQEGQLRARFSDAVAAVGPTRGGFFWLAREQTWDIHFSHV